MKIVRTYRDFKSKGYFRAFLEWLIGFTVLLVVLMLLTGNSLITSLTVGGVLGIISAIIIVPMGYWYEEIELKKIMSKRLDSPTFKPLLKAGFQKRGIILEGIYNGYYGYAYWTEGNPYGSEGKLSYAVRVIFEFEGDVELTTNFLELLESKRIKLSENHIEGILNSGRSKLPTQKELIYKVNELVRILTENNLVPTNFNK
ncbi:hypothetical protein [Zobellia russellii]|uniref:hypothetical protein n=1 Tax=Zobellia russellii TaxID=248907 RepID=UPI001BFF7C54|nr:hypothetical protein [Zobellia russellii]MBT9186678.1 hypothetical protein [Zobellia russellii]